MTRTNEYHWTFGNGCHISFPNGGDPVQEANHAFNTDEGCAAISDSAGTLLFYTDGRDLYDGVHTQINNLPLGGHPSSANSAIVVPPAGNGSLFHVFAMGTWSAGSNTNDVLKYTPVSVVGNNTVSIPTQTRDVIDPVRGADWQASEAMAATSHTDCDKYWVVALDANNNEWVSILIDSDIGPQPGNMRRSLYGAPHPASNVFGMRISADGRFIAHANVQAPRVNTHNTPRSRTSIDIFNFDRSTGAITYHSQISQLGRSSSPYGMEFSNNSEHLYFSDYVLGTIHRHTVGVSVTHAQCDPIFNYRGEIGALQMGPNGKIYAAKRNQSTLISIDQPNAVLNTPTNATTNRTDIGFRTIAEKLGGGNLNLGGRAELGLTVFTRVADDCVVSKCDRIASEVDEALWNATEQHRESMKPCDHDSDEPWPTPTTPAICEPLDFERPQPSVFITHSDSDCDCIESDDVETMSITVCNRYDNITLTDLTIQSMELVDPNGGPPAPLPDGSPSVEITPIGPFCFGDIPPCSCVSRQFSMRLRGALAGTYKLKITAICFSWQVAESQERCFELEVCAD